MRCDPTCLAVAQHAHVCLAQCRWADAAALYSWLVAHQPQDARSRKALAYALIELGRTREAIDALRSLDARGDAVAQYLLARIRVRLADPRAQASFTRFAALRQRATAARHRDEAQANAEAADAVLTGEPKP